jgi:hypothetical protein
MKFEFGDASKLRGRKVNSPVDRFSYIPRSADDGFEEYILAFRELPPEEAEPDLFKGATADKTTYPGEVWLTYDGLGDTRVIMLTLEADDRFRLNNPGLVAQNELFRLDRE